MYVCVCVRVSICAFVREYVYMPSCVYARARACVCVCVCIFQISDDNMSLPYFLPLTIFQT